MSPNLPSDFFTLESMLTLGGASAAVFAVTNTIRKLTGWKSLSIAFVTALLIVFYGSYSLGCLTNAGSFVIAFLNSCLLFCTALGIGESGAKLAGVSAAAVGVAPDRAARRSRPWFGSWLGA